MKSKVIATTQYGNGYTLEFLTGFNTILKKYSRTPRGDEYKNDVQLLLKKDNEVKLSAICHFGSYGQGEGLWEIMPNNPPQNWGDSVRGHLTFKEVVKYMDREIRLDKK